MLGYFKLIFHFPLSLSFIPEHKLNDGTDCGDVRGQLPEGLYIIIERKMFWDI